eukprot:gene10874-12084_t
MPKNRSNSSQEQRKSLKKNYVVIPEVNARVDLLRYLRYAKGAYEDALSQVKRNNLPSAYIELEKFFTLALERIPKHVSYRNSQHDLILSEELIWLKKAMIHAVDVLEDVVCKMDEVADRLRLWKEEESLIDAFDGPDLSISTALPPATPLTTELPALATANTTSLPIDVRPPASSDSSSSASMVPIVEEAKDEDYENPYAANYRDGHVLECQPSVEMVDNTFPPLSEIPSAPPAEVLDEIPSVVPTPSVAPVLCGDQVQTSGEVNLLGEEITCIPIPPTSPSSSLQIAGVDTVSNTSASSTAVGGVQSLSPLGAALPAQPLFAHSGVLFPSTTPAPVTSSPLKPSSSSSLAILLAPPTTNSSSVSAPIISTVPQQGKMTALAMATARSYFSNEEVIICQQCLHHSVFSVPPPATSLVEIRLGNKGTLQFLKDDFHTSFGGFLTGIAPDLLLSQPALEVNRCFFIHLGIAVGVHPFLLQSAFRLFANEALRNTDIWYQELLQSVLARGGFVDANVLCFLWPVEFDDCRLLFISNPSTKPIFSEFTYSNNAKKEVIILCEREHFTLLRPTQQHSGQGIREIDHILAQATAAGMTVHHNNIERNNKHSIQRLVDAFWSS